MTEEWHTSQEWVQGGMYVVNELPAFAAKTTIADAYDVQLRFYAGPTFSSLTLANYTPEEWTLPVGWVSETDFGIDTAGWVDVTDMVYYRGSFTSDWTESSITWKATIEGQNYDADYFGVGKAILCLRKLTAYLESASWYGSWEIDWLGQVVSGRFNEDYRVGAEWTRDIGGLDASLARANAPRLDRKSVV